MTGSEAMSCYLKDAQLLLCPLRRALSGARLEADPVVSAPLDTSPAVLAQMIKEVLTASLEPLAVDHVGYLSPLLKLTGSRSTREFLRGTRYCCIERVGQEFWVTPGIPTKGGFDFTEEGEARVAVEETPMALAVALLRVLTAARTYL